MGRGGKHTKAMGSIVALAEANGWRVERRRKATLMYPADKALSPVVVHATPSDGRAIRNLLSELRKRGLQCQVSEVL